MDDEGKGKAEVIAKEYGKVGNCPAMAINKMPRTLSGITIVYNEKEVTNGYEEESDEDLRDRYYDKVRNPGLAGNKAHYREWSQSIDGVGEVEVTAVWEKADLDYVLVTLLDRNGKPANQDLVDEVFNYINDEQLPIGAKLKVQPALSELINISADLVLHDNWDIEEIKESMALSLTDYFQSFVFKEKVVSYAKIGSIILSTNGVKDYSDLLVNDGVLNIDIKELSVPIVGKLELGI